MLVQLRDKREGRQGSGKRKGEGKYPVRRKEDVTVFPSAQAAISNLLTMGPPSEIPAHPVAFPTSRPMKSVLGAWGRESPKV